MPSADVPVITGYYRWTDIWYEWKNVLSPEDGEAVKAILAHDAITHPDHPLHPGKKGVDLYLGIFETGEARLLFSSKQVDYVRYWLHAMGLTKELVRLPYSDCLLTAANLKTISPIKYADGSALRNAIKDIDKNNKRLKGSDPRLAHKRHVFERIRKVWSEKKGVWFSIDFEAWELDSKMITEFGWSSICWQNKEPAEDRGHLIVEEGLMYMNTQYVKGNRDHYNFGDSQIIKRKAFISMINSMFASLRHQQPVFLVFHDAKQDLKYLNEMKVDLESLSYLIPESTNATGLFVVDTAELIAALLGDNSGNNKGLEDTCRLLQLHPKNMHNAGNDAHYTMLAMQTMADGDTLDIQREKRWPSQTKTGLKVDLEPWQEDDDYSDQEGIFGFIDNSKQLKEKQEENPEKAKSSEAEADQPEAKI
ncbi:hypothetical protein CPB83DRAFT_843895 [Crepidotus variabilis]|uniref:Gfd2/YDR514C-like C-terminal domain-containing protein n=1 Tax=Crepidotus variabilis TaxID=179855 RepID=A0A9P6JVU0_9AGAR|nr:hypothetical protein CPB83DRAFT_843895 [Crepidotus variabilis]